MFDVTDASRNRKFCSKTRRTVFEKRGVHDAVLDKRTISSGYIRQFLTTLSADPGVYRMHDKLGNALYVGKAKNLKKRVSSYFCGTKDNRTNTFVRQIDTIEIIITNSENEALLLENTLIKTLRPKYNILFKDDKSYPYLYLSEHKFPRLTIYRGSKNDSGAYFGPYTDNHAMRKTLQILQKVFRLRQCSDIFFRNRSRPCVQYQIKRCSAPCMEYIGVDEYQENVRLIKDFLNGKNRIVLKKVQQHMRDAAKKLQYELATQYRNQLIDLKKIFEQQFVVDKTGDVDAIALVKSEQYLCMNIIFIRSGQVTGMRSYFAKTDMLTVEEIFSSFVIQYYLNARHVKVVPKRIVVNRKLYDREWVESALSEHLQRRIKIVSHARGNSRKWLEMAKNNARHALMTFLAKRADITKAYLELVDIFRLSRPPEKMECFDISHTFGAQTVASCVVFDAKGAKKQDYRRYKIENVAKSDDYAAIRQALQRRYEKHRLPDLVVVDGGKGQLRVAKDVLGDRVDIIAIAKGPTRKPGLEEIYATTIPAPIFLESDSRALHLLQHIRDESHRFAVSGHRKQRAKAMISSVFEQIPGVGPKTRQKLLAHFGGLQEVKLASIDELLCVTGVNRRLAERIHAQLTNY